MNAVPDRSVQLLAPVKRWMYKGGHPNALARFLNRLGAVQYAKGLLSPSCAVTLHVKGRTSGRTITFPLALFEHHGEEYLVSMLGNDANWVRNVRADGGHAVLERGTRRDVVLQDVDVALRGPILRDRLAVAPGGPDGRTSRSTGARRWRSSAKIADQFRVFIVRSAG